MLDSLRTPGFRMVELFEASRFSYGLTLRLPGFRMIGLSVAPR